MHLVGAQDSLPSLEESLLVVGPGIMGDDQAIHECGLSKLVESTHGALYCISDCAYTPTEKLVPIYRSEQSAKERYDNFNFYASQLHIHIEMAFGVMVKKWGILQRPITISICNIKHLICAIGVLHNFCINEQILNHGGIGIFCPKNINFLQKRQFSIMLLWNLMEQTWYMILQWDIQITESMLYTN